MNRHFKLIIALMIVLIAASMTCTSLALWGTMYANKSKVSVYAEDNEDSEIIKTYKGGKEITVDAVSPDGKWAQISVGGGLGFIKMSELSREIPQSFCSHDWGKWMVEREPTCTETGYRYRFCIICGLRDEQSTKKLPHEYGSWKVTEKATCVKKGERVRTCKVCGHKDTETFLEDHQFGSWSMIKEPACTEKGARVHTCKVCGLEKTQELKKLPHDYDYVVTVEATDHSSGVRSKICKNCGHNGGEEKFDPEGTLRRKARGDEVRALQQLLVDQGYLNAGGVDGAFGGGTEKAIKKFQADQGLEPDGVAWPQTRQRLQHEFGPWQTVKPMTRTEAGERVRVCTECGYEQHETIESGTVFERGRRGNDIRALQQIIKQVGYDAGGFDGIYGKKLDRAMAGFAEANGLTVEEGKVRPADVDAVVNAWLQAAPAETWMGEGTLAGPVNLALTVTPAGEPDDNGIVTYNWSLTNLGSGKVMFNALLLNFGENPDFRQGSLVMVLDGFELKPGAGNSASGSFNADSKWGEGSLNFAAMAITDKTGEKWLSNTVVFENDSNPAARTLMPDEVALDVGNLPDGTYPVSFDRGDLLAGASGTYMNAVHVFTQDHYDPVAVSALKVGDTIVVEGEEVPVLTLGTDEYGDIVVNEDQDARAFYLTTREDTNGYFIQGLDDMTTYTDHGATTLVIDPAATFTDAWDIESEPVTVAYDGIVEAMQTSINDYFVPYNTTVRIEAGRVVEIQRVYVP